MPLHALSFRLWVEMVEPVFVTRHDVEQEVVALGDMSSKQLSRHIHGLESFCVRP
jgi:hypothetical protein